MNRPMRITHQRELLLQELSRCNTHPTADELYGRIKKKLPRISLATVYRNLEILSQAGIIKKLEVSGRQKRFDWNPDNHNHIFCTLCQQVEDIPAPPDPVPFLETTEDRGYRITGYRIEYFGFCPKCLKKIDRKKEKGSKTMTQPSASVPTLSENQRLVLEALAQKTEPCGGKDLATATGLESKLVSCQITALKNKGLVSSPVRCQYQITDEGRSLID